MASLHEQFKKDLRKLFGLHEDEVDDMVADAAGGEAGAGNEAGGDSGGEDSRSPEELGVDKNDAEQLNAGLDSEADAGQEDPATGGEKGAIDDTPEDDTAGAEPEAPESETVPGTGDTVTSESSTDGGKVSSMFRDMGNPETDFGLTNPNNVRLAKFRFTKAGIDINQMMNDVEKKIGMTSDKLVYRLTPEQLESYREKGKDLRRKFELIEKREKNIILFNSRIPMYYLDKNTNKVDKIDETNPNLLKNAFSKIDEFLTKRFGEHWVDDFNAIDFAQSIKVNFAEKDSITPNMITAKFFEGEEEKLIPFNKLFVRTPKSVEDFVKENKENQTYLRSSVFRTIAAGYLEGSTDSNGVFAILKGEAPADDSGVPGGDAEGDAEATGDNPEAEAEAAMADIEGDLGVPAEGGEAGGETQPEPTPEPV